jgi:hypothetical protein
MLSIPNIPNCGSAFRKKGKKFGTTAADVMRVVDDMTVGTRVE